MSCCHRQALPKQTIPWWRVAMGLVLSAQSMLASLVINLNPDNQALWYGGGIVLLVMAGLAMLLLARPFVQTCIQSLLERRFAIEYLYLLSMVAACLVSFRAMGLHQGYYYFETITVLLTVYAVNRNVIAYGETQRAQLFANVQILPPARVLQRDGGMILLDAQQLTPGMQVLAYPGEMILAHAVIKQGSGFVCEAMVNGEPGLQSKQPGDGLVAQTLCIDGSLLYEVVTPIDPQGQALAAAQAMRMAQSPLLLLAQRWQRRFLPVVLGISGLAFLAWGFGQGSFEQGFWVAMSMVLVACPCAFATAMPLGYTLIMLRLQTLGVRLRRGLGIERLASLDTLVFDKTGTLSQATVTSASMQVHPQWSKQPALWQSLLHGLAQTQSHPMLKNLQLWPNAVKQYPWQIVQCNVVAGLGMVAQCRLAAGPLQTVMVGSLNWLLAQKLGHSDWLASCPDHPVDQDDVHSMAMAIDEVVVARWRVQDMIMANWPQLYRRLCAMHIDCQVVSGDVAARVHKMGEWLPQPPTLLAGQSKQQKMLHILQLQQAGRTVGFVGDGLNDVWAMQAAGLAIAPAASAMAQAADVVVASLAQLPTAIVVCRHAMRILQTTLLIALIYNVVAMLIASLGWMHPALAAALMLISSSTVSLRSLQLLQNQTAIL